MYRFLKKRTDTRSVLASNECGSNLSMSMSIARVADILLEEMLKKARSNRVPKLHELVSFYCARTRTLVASIKATLMT